MRVNLQLPHLLHLIQHLMHVELGHEELQAAVSVSLTAKNTGSSGGVNISIVCMHKTHDLCFVCYYCMLLCSGPLKEPV